MRCGLETWTAYLGNGYHMAHHWTSTAGDTQVTGGGGLVAVLSHFLLDHVDDALNEAAVAQQVAQSSVNSQSMLTKIYHT
jgi:hypothetical protein